MLKRYSFIPAIWAALLVFWALPALAEMIVDTAWVRRYNGPADSDDKASAIAVDGSGNVYVTGWSYGSGTYWDYATLKYYPNGDTACNYFYSDDFSTRKAEMHSYAHSPFVDSLPDIFLDGLLVWMDDQTLGFFKGFLVDAYAYLCYEFPLEGEWGIITGGTLKVDVFAGGYNPIFWVSTSGDGIVWQPVGVIGSSGHYEYGLMPEDSCTSLFLMFSGGDMFLDEFSISLTFSNGFTTNIALHSGWQWISTNVDPNPCEMESIFVNCWGDLGIIIACDGSFCIPGVGCWIDCWKVCEMYKLHMADACTVEVCGSKVPTDNPCPLPAGWNCIAYFPECPLEPETALVSIWDNLDIVQNDAGEFCIPGVGCWIDCMEYNEGYKIHLSSADTLVYPINCPPCPPPFAKKKSFPGFARTTHFNYSRNTGESYSIVVNSVELDGKHPEVGDEIGVFTSSELCVGAGLWQEEILGIAIWQDDDRTEAVDGFQVGEQMIFKLWDKTENKEIELFASFEKGDGRFGTDAYALVSLKGISSQLPERFELAQNYPNPFNPETKISYALPKDCHVKLTIYNMLGQKIKVLVDEHQTAGHKNVHWDGKDYKGNEVASGIYFFRIEAGDLTQSKKMVILK